MEQITLNHITKQGNTISFDFSVSDGLSPYFSGRPFLIEYPENIESVPDGVAAVPFVCNVLPIIWLTDAVLRIPELDSAFYECIPNLRGGYETLYPDAVFAGRLEVSQLISCGQDASGKSAVFFSGGLDAVNTLVAHLEEHPALISIWGADVRFENVSGWEAVHSGIAEYARKFDLPDVVIRSTLRSFDHENALVARFKQHVHGGWWHDMKHGMALLGHAAPYAYLHGVSTVYIASSYCPADGLVQCASSPLIDNHMRYAGARVIHDGFEFTRQDKIHNVVDFVTRTKNRLSLHVCWESQSGSNCSKCEKCYRTMAGLIAEGADPSDYGFHAVGENISMMHARMIRQKLLPPHSAECFWAQIGDRMKVNRKLVRQSPFWKDVKWMLKADFCHPETLYISREKMIRQFLAKFRFYQLLHEIKEKL